MSTCHHCSFHWLRQPWQSSQQPAVQQRYPDELFAPLFESFLLELKVIGWAWWFSKHLFSYFSLQLAFFHWLERYLLSVPFQKKCDRTPSGWRIPSLWGALSRLLTGPGSQKELLRSFNFIEPSVVWNHTGVAIYIVEDLPTCWVYRPISGTCRNGMKEMTIQTGTGKVTHKVRREDCSKPDVWHNDAWFGTSFWRTRMQSCPRFRSVHIQAGIRQVKGAFGEDRTDQRKTCFLFAWK